MATLGNPKNTIEILNKYQFMFQKRFGQNFLIDTHVLEKIIKSAEITKEDVYRVLCCDSKILPKYDLYPEKPIFPSRIRFADRFKKLITTTDKKIVFLSTDTFCSSA